MKLVKLTVFLGAVAVIALITGCSKPDSSSSRSSESAGTSGKAKKLVIYTHQTQQILGDEVKDPNGNTYRDPATAHLKNLTPKFTQETGIEIEFVTYSSDGAVVKSLLQVGDPGLDLYTTGFTQSIAEFERFTAPIMSAQEGADKYGHDLASAMTQVNGNVHNLQIAKEYGEAVTYNEEVIKAAGYNEIPGTIAEFEDMLGKIKANGVDPISLHRVENWPLYTLDPFSHYVGGEMDTLPKLMNESAPFSDSTAIGKTVKMYTIWKSKGYFEREIYADFGVAMDAVSYGKSGMFLFGSWVFQQVKSRVPAGKDAGIIKFDAVPDFGKGRFIGVNPAQGYAINKASKNIPEAKQFLEWLSKQTDFLVTIGVIPTHKDAKPGVPAQFSIIDSRVRSGEVKQLVAAPITQNSIDSEEVLKEANLYADNKWAGLLFDSLDITKPDDWTAYNAQVERQNAAYLEAVKLLGVKYDPNRK
ncbi:MAG: extracellular solute-binding protein [Treponema sp.]|jgi:ABC-type glycerol-3-phosphate transport system substrate-binding protein|nr:extracellular solute-binding protein [Treponema sp.]